MIMPISVGVPSATWAARSVGLNLKRGIWQRNDKEQIRQSL